ncbi:MAG: sn-glycerol-3-phosphate ABC transporter ATP-binding protein UgpC [Clostridiales bacterium]|nr:sn-glycerol-3-phosphate ABC transporter ATP-binding protein UgpC [Clostridiales bacterium]
MASLSLRHIYKKYPGGVTAVSDFCLEVKDTEFIIFVGPSGCGKSTTLRMIAGLEEITEGELYIGDRLVNDVAPKDRDIAMVFQNYALYPHMTVFDNMAFGLKLRKVPKETIKRKVEEAARILDISHLLDRLPKALSGGQKQRVALGRAIVRDPKVFLLDEPLSNLDAKLRAAMRTEITKLHNSLQATFIYVTHDQVEAMTMATRIVVMKDGVIQQVDSPQSLYDNPVNLFVAGFIGTPQMNFINGTLERDDDGFVYLHFGEIRIRLPEEKGNADEIKPYIEKEVIAGVRPECIVDTPMQIAAMQEASFDAYCDVTELMGAEIYLYLIANKVEVDEKLAERKNVVIDKSGEQKLIARVSPRSTVRAGDTVTLAIDTTRMHLFDKETEKAIVFLTEEEKKKAARVAEAEKAAAEAEEQGTEETETVEAEAVETEAPVEESTTDTSVTDESVTE